MLYVRERLTASTRSDEQPIMKRASLKTVGLFAGIGGIERGFELAGHRTRFLCELDRGAQEILRNHFPGVRVLGDIRDIDRLPKVDIVAAGFPCQDLSQAGRTAGIDGGQSGLVAEVFRLVRDASPRWLVLENVPFMLQLGRGKAMRFITDSLEEIGFSWAYRVIDAHAFGRPQRRQRVILVASRDCDPRRVLFVDDTKVPELTDADSVGCGFYWTEGIRGLGWAINAVPTLKGGSTIGIPSPPAIRLPKGEGIVLPDIRDAERLQGFDVDWTLPAVTNLKMRSGSRWKYVGNSVSVPMAQWLGERLARPGEYTEKNERPLGRDEAWPRAAWGANGECRRVEISMWPVQRPLQHLLDFLQFPMKPLSARASAGFLRRTKISTLHFPAGFIEDVSRHLEKMLR